MDEKTESMVLLQEEIHRKVLLIHDTQYKGMSYCSPVPNTMFCNICVEEKQLESVNHENCFGTAL